MTALLICSGSIEEYSFYKRYIETANYIICVDGGARHAKKFDIKPDLLLGDFDSIEQNDLDFFKKNNTQILKFSKNKDFTDSELAINIAVEKGFKKIVLIAALGCRLDHSLANILLLKKFIKKGIQISIVNEKNEIFMVDKEIELKREENTKVSLLSLTDKVEGISTKGLLYALRDAKLKMGQTLGVSNEFIEDYATIKIKSGVLLVFKSRD